VSIIHAKVEDNLAFDGGAVAVTQGATLEMEYTNMSNNEARHNGGTIFVSASHIDLDHFTITHSGAKENGGAAFLEGGTTTASIRHGFMKVRRAGECCAHQVDRPAAELATVVSTAVTFIPSTHSLCQLLPFTPRTSVCLFARLLAIALFPGL
jgi:hypothetical protein